MYETLIAACCAIAGLQPPLAQSWSDTNLIRADDDWSVSFYRGAPAESAPARAPAGSEALDVRGLEPPQPMVAVLERLETLAPGQTLTVVHDRRPTFLYPQLDARGFTHRTDEPEPGLIRIVIERPVS